MFTINQDKAIPHRLEFLKQIPKKNIITALNSQILIKYMNMKQSNSMILHHAHTGDRQLTHNGCTLKERIKISK
jgi:mannose/fructose-specific phosphotransferase system component IIA